MHSELVEEFMQLCAQTEGAHAPAFDMRSEYVVDFEGLSGYLRVLRVLWFLAS